MEEFIYGLSSWTVTDSYFNITTYIESVEKQKEKRFSVEARS